MGGGAVRRRPGRARGVRRGSRGRTRLPDPTGGDGARGGGDRGGRPLRGVGAGGMDLGNGLGQLTYSTLVHPTDTWEDVWTSVTTYLPRVKECVSPAEPLGVSRRLSAATASRLVEDDGARDDLRRFLADQDLYVYTAN